MNTFKLISEILVREAEGTEAADIKNNPKLVAIKKKAEIIRTKAELLRAQNQQQTAQLDNAKIKQKEAEHKEKVKTINIKKPADVNLASGNPINEPKQEPVQSSPSVQQEPLQPPQPQQEPVQAQPEQESLDEDVLEPSDTANTVNEDEENDKELSKVPGEDEEQQDNTNQEEPEQKEDEEAVAEVAGEKPQSKEEAEIARLQAQTREIQSRIGEYKTAGGAGDPNAQIDPATGQPIDPNVQSQVDPATGQPIDPNAQIDPMTGQPIAPPQPPDPLKGFGDTTDPQASQMAMMGGMPGSIDPMTGQPIDQGPSKTATAVGRLYILKKIYYKLALLDKILTNSPDTELQEVARITSEAFSIYRTIIQNLKTYKDQIDEVIVDYYMLVKDIAAHVEKHFIMKAT